MDKKGNKKIDYSKMRKVKYVNNNIDRSPYFYLSYQSRLILLFIGIVLLCWLSYFLINKSFANYNTVELDYSENGNINYNISLLENNYYSSNRLEGDSNRQYVSSLIDKINADFRYNSFFSDKAVLAYDYDITGRLKVYGEDDKILLDEKYDLLEKAEDTIYGKKLNINKSLEIDYQRYNNIAKEYTQNYAPNANSVFVISMNINYNGTYDKFNDTTSINTVYSYFGLACLIIATMLTIRFITLILLLKPKKSKYCSLRDGYLKTYDRIIVNTKKLPRFGDTNIIDCYDFNELLDAQETLELPINYHEIVKNQKCVFYIKNGKDIYKYTLKECDLEY